MKREKEEEKKEKEVEEERFQHKDVLLQKLIFKLMADCQTKVRRPGRVRGVGG